MKFGTGEGKEGSACGLYRIGPVTEERLVKEDA